MYEEGARSDESCDGLLRTLRRGRKTDLIMGAVLVTMVLIGLVWMVVSSWRAFHAAMESLGAFTVDTSLHIRVVNHADRQLEPLEPVSVDATGPSTPNRERIALSLQGASVDSHDPSVDSPASAYGPAAEDLRSYHGLAWMLMAPLLSVAAVLFIKALHSDICIKMVLFQRGQQRRFPAEP